MGESKLRTVFSLSLLSSNSVTEKPDDMQRITTRQLILKLRPFRWATILFAIAFFVNMYIAICYWTILGARIIVGFSLPIGLHLPLTWWRLGRCIDRSYASSKNSFRDPAGEPEATELSSPGNDLNHLSFWIAFLPTMCLLFLLFVLRRGGPS